jgi:alkanesulfonate monooxygenase SsuD/methylene tetrahydromethanopterin reductase-like flavin-dependent oxidoreductase (luciferase family)
MSSIVSPTRLSTSWAWPKPVQQPSVPVLLGCRLTPAGYAEIASWADGWIGYGSDLDLFGSQVAALRSRLTSTAV